MGYSPKGILTGNWYLAILILGLTWQTGQGCFIFCRGNPPVVAPMPETLIMSLMAG
ncbi:MAG: hypothetical protein WBA24_03960 [Geitlerinemataceae cyanobacterium]